MPEIETERLRHRMLRKEDLEDLMSIVGDRDVMRHIGVEGGVALSREEAEDAVTRMIAFWNLRGFGRWAVLNKSNQTMVGLCGLRLMDDTPELFYAFAKEFWGLGLATESARACLRYGFEELGFNRIVAACRHANAASIRVMEKIGMRYEKEINYQGVEAVCYAITRDEFPLDDSMYFVTRD
ncbi:MAG TPA: GNAT family N-acetyltransferase [Pyrinomonadaceae bacterium]